MAKPKKQKINTGINKVPSRSVTKITEKFVPISLQTQLEQLKLDKSSKAQKLQEAQEELQRSSLSPDESENQQATQLESGIGWLADRLARDRDVNNKRREEEDKKPKTIELTKAGLPRIIAELRKGECTVEFYKRTSRPRGEKRRMRCTLENITVIPRNPIREGIITVWDLDANDWRSFYHTSIERLIRNEQTDAQ